MMISLVSLSDHRAKNARNNQLSWKRLACRQPLTRRCVIVGEKTTVDLVTSLKQTNIIKTKNYSGGYCGNAGAGKLIWDELHD